MKKGVKKLKIREQKTKNITRRFLIIYYFQR